MKSIMLLIFSVMLIHKRENIHVVRYQIQGIVTTEDQKPVPNVHIYSVEGEEETFTDRNGKFELQTYQQLPLKLTAKHKDFKNKVIEVSSADKQVIIQLNKS